MIGAHLLYELLTRTSSTIVCMVRNRKKENEDNEPIQAIIEAMKFYEIWNEDFIPRINAV